jgi:ABC-2 type transport system permease protein
VLGTLGMPVILYVLFGRLGGGGRSGGRPVDAPAFIGQDLAVFAATFVALGAVTSLVAIIAIYRESGILKRLRATPLRPETILLAHVLVKLLFSALTLGVLALLGRQFLPANAAPPWLPFIVAVLFATACILSIGFVIASVVPTARFAQPAAAFVLYPMLALSGLFVPIELLPRSLRLLARVVPLTYAVELQRGIWRGEGWLAHGGDIAALLLTCVLALLVTSKVFRWE